MCNNHILTAKNVGRTKKYRISELFSNFNCFFCCHYSKSGRTRNLALFKKFIKSFSVLGCINAVSRCSEDIYSEVCQMTCKLDSCLTAELNDYAIRLFSFDNGFNIFLCQRIEIKSVTCVKVSGNSFRIVVADNCLISFFFKCPYAVN